MASSGRAWHSRILCWFLAFPLVTFAGAVAQQSVDDEKSESFSAVKVTTLPEVDRGIHDAIQSKSYGDAVKRIEAAISDGTGGPPDYLRYLQGIALTEDNQLDSAIEAFEQLEREHPDSPWISRSRFGRANVFVLRRQYIDAGKIYQSEAERLLSQDRKDTLAQIYLEFADRYYEGVPADDPSKARQPDYQQALTYYEEAGKLRTTPALSQKIDFRIARCQEELKQSEQAIASYQRFIDRYGEKPGNAQPAATEILAEAQFRLGDVHLQSGNPALARKIWQDFLLEWRDLGTENEAIESFLARSEYRLAHTYGFPAPSSVADLELGVSAAERFLQRYPQHELAPRAELEIAQGYAAHQRHAQAVQRLLTLLGNPRYQESPEIPIAREMLGRQYLAQGEYDKAIDSWKTFLEQHPTDPKWPSVQSQVVDTEYAKAKDAKDRKEYDEARELWLTFLNKYPLDSRAASVLLQFGQMKLSAAEESEPGQPTEASADDRSVPEEESKLAELYEHAIADWRRVVAKYPQSDEASQAGFLIGVTLEDKLGRLAEALDAYRQVIGSYQPEASRRIAALTSPLLQVVTERKYRTDERPAIRLSTRNLEKVDVKLYRVDMVDYFRKMHLSSGLESLDIALIDPDDQFIHEIADYEAYKQIDSDVVLPIEGPGVTAVTVASEKLEATTMVVVSDLDMIVKASRNELFLFVEDMRKQAPAEGVTILVSDGGSVFAEAVTDAEGIVQRSFEQLKTANDLRIFATRDGHTAATINSLAGLQFAVGLTPKGFLYTDRPAYRPGQAVNIKGIVRWVEQDRHVFRAGESLQLEVFDPRGRQLISKEVALGDFGTVNSNLILPQAAIQGQYRVHLHRAKSGESDKIGELSFDTQFTVAPYQLEPVQLRIDLDKDVYYRGETVRGTLHLQYYYGMPLAGESIQYRLGQDGELVTARTDEEGSVSLELETQRFHEAQVVELTVESPTRNLRASKPMYLATRGFTIIPSTTREVFVSGEPFETLFKVTDPAGKPVGTELKVEILHRIETYRGTGESLVEVQTLQSDAGSGEAVHTIRLDESGHYLVRATGTDQFGNQVSGQTQVQISGDDDKMRLRILADRLSFSSGDEATFNLHWREQPALALVTLEGARVLNHRLILLQEGDNPLKMEMTGDLVPNVFLNVAVMHRNEFHSAQTEIRVSQALNVVVKPLQDEVKPGDEVTVEISTTDTSGSPVRAELSLAVVQANLLGMFQDLQSPIADFFASGQRQTSVRPASSCTFAYRPETRSVSQTLLAEADRRALLERELRALEERGDLFADGAMMPTTSAEGRESLSDFEVDADNAIIHLHAGLGFEADGIADDFSQQAELGAMLGEQLAEPQQQLERMQQRGGRLREIVRFRTEVLNGRQVQVPYLVAPSSGSVRLPDLERLSSHLYFEQLSRAGSAAPYQKNLAANEPVLWQSRSYSGVTANNQLVTINADSHADFAEIARDQNLRLLPGTGVSEAAYWDPMIVTGDDGKATVTFAMPQRSTLWNLRAKGVNRETLAGEATAELITKKNLFAEIKLPLAFTDGDRAVVPVEIHHSEDGDRKVSIRLTCAIGEKSVQQSRSVDLSGPGITPASFEVQIDSGDQAAFELVLAEGDTVLDQVSQTVAIHPYGFPVYQTTGGSFSQSTVALIDFESAVRPDGAALQILVGPSANRALIESVLGSNAVLFDRCLGPVSSPLERSTSDILGGVAVLKMIGSSRDATRPDADAMNARIVAAITQLVSSQNEQGGWNWRGSPAMNESDTFLSARAMWAWSVARQAGFAVPQASFELGQAYLRSAFSSSDQGDLERQAILLHALAVCGSGDFALANRLYRERNRLNSSGLIHLILAMEQLEHPEMARDLLELVEIPASGPVSGRNGATAISPWMQDPNELRAIYMLALQSLRSGDPAIGELAKSLLSQRLGTRWPIEKSNGPVIAALANWFRNDQGQSQKFRLTVSVNDNEVAVLDMDPSLDGSRQLQVPATLLDRDKPQRIEFHLEGRATFSYSAVLSGFLPAEKITATTKTWTVARRYEPAHRMLDGRAVPRGFGVVDGNYRSFTNPLTQLAVGNRAEITLSPRRHLAPGARDESNDYLILTETIPAGCNVLEESVQGAFERFELEPGRITFFIGNRRYPGDIHYTLVGYVPGQYRATPSLLRNYFLPAELTVAETKTLQVLPAGELTVDQYRLTPDELYHLGEQEIAKRQFDSAHQHLSELYGNWQLRPEIQKNVVPWLFAASLAKADHGDSVRYFEILKEKFPDVEISFQDILQVAKSYRELAEYERSYLVYRATLQGSFERESQVAGFLNARGEFVRSVQAMESLLRDYPAESYLATAAYALAQETYRRAANVNQDQRMRSQGLTRIHLVDAAITMLDHFLTTWPDDPASDEASFALATALIDLEKYRDAIDRSEKYAERYSDSRLLDSYWYMIGYSHFELEHPEQALEMCRKVAEATFPVPETGGTRPADNRWEAVYIMGQVYHSLGKAANAIAEYTKVKDRFADAAEAIAFFSRKSIQLDEVTTIRPDAPKQVDLKFRNIGQAAIKVYRIDLMKFGLLQRNLDRITAINLAGIRPYHEVTVDLGDGNDYRDRVHNLSLPLDQEGAYLMVCRGDELYASGLVLVTPLSLQIQEDVESGRVRVSVKDDISDSFVSDVHVKVIGSANSEFVSGSTDLRGLFIADDIRGTATVIAAAEKGRYAFFRGERALQPGTVQDESQNGPFGAPASQEAAQVPVDGTGADEGKNSLRDNLFRQNQMFQDVQKGNYDSLMNNDRSGIKSKEAF